MSAIATVTAYNETADSFTLTDANGIGFEVAAKHVPLIETESEPIDAIGREVELVKHLKGLHTQAVKAAEAEAARASNDCEALYDALMSALKVRQSRVPSADTLRALGLLERNERAVKVGMRAFPSEVLRKLIDNQNNDAKATDNFVAVKVNVKIVCCLAAIGQGLQSTLDAYSVSIIKNLLSHQALDTLNAYRSICTKIEVSETDIAKAVRVYHDCSPSTAMTQTSSTREMLRHLDIVNAVKRAKGDVISFKETQQMQSLVALFA